MCNIVSRLITSFFIYLYSYIIILASSSPIIQFYHFFSSICKSLRNLNLYKTTSTDEVDLRQQRIHTRIYLVLLITCLGVLLFYTAIVERSVIRIQAVSSIEDYEHLQNLYSEDVSCPCRRISILYNEFVTELRVNTFHQACSIVLIDRSFDAGNYTL